MNSLKSKRSMKEKERRERKTGIGSLRPINISLVTVIPTSGFSVTALLHTYSLPTRPILGLPSRSLQVHLRDLRRKYNGRYHLYLPLASFLFYSTDQPSASANLSHFLSNLQPPPYPIRLIVNLTPSCSPSRQYLAAHLNHSF